MHINRFRGETRRLVWRREHGSTSTAMKAKNQSFRVYKDKFRREERAKARQAIRNSLPFIGTEGEDWLPVDRLPAPKNNIWWWWW